MAELAAVAVAAGRPSRSIEYLPGLLFGARDRDSEIASNSKGGSDLLVGSILVLETRRCW